MKLLTVSELAGQADVGVETIRFYQRKGLLRRPEGVGRSGNGIRHYDADDARRLRFIRSAQAAGFTLREVARLLELDSGEDRAQVRELAQARVAALDAEIEAKTQARDALARLARDCARSQAGPCPILDAFELG